MVAAYCCVLPCSACLKVTCRPLYGEKEFENKFQFIEQKKENILKN